MDYYKAISGNKIESYEYTYDKNSQITSEKATTSGSTEVRNYTYSPKGQLTRTDITEKGQTKSTMYGDANDIQNLLNDKAGTGDFLGTNKERVNFGQVIGQYVDPKTGIGVETTMGIIHYGKKGAHIVPARPN